MPVTLPPPVLPAGRHADRAPAYVLDEELRDAVRIATAIDRPLLLRGTPGSGKSTLARWVAEQWGWTYLEEVITSRTQARDLLWRFDAVRRLADAQLGARAKKDLTPARYVEPGVLWRAFDPEGAAAQAEVGGLKLPPDNATGCVVLLDEIDKAEPDVPNDLLVPLGETRFDVPDARGSVSRKRPVLVVLTDNGERDLPPAFLRRCVTTRLLDPAPTQLVEIARAHGVPIHEDDLMRYAEDFDELRSTNKERPLSTAEFLDALAAVERVGDVGWEMIRAVVAVKATEPRT